MMTKIERALNKIAAAIQTHDVSTPVALVNRLGDIMTTGARRASEGYDKAIDRLSTLPGIAHLGKYMAGGVSDAQRSEIDRKLLGQRQWAEGRKAAERALTPAAYAHPHNVIGPNAGKWRNALHDAELRANTRAGASGKLFPLDPQKPYLRGQTVVSSYDQTDPQKYAKFTELRDRARNSLGPLRYMNPANVFHSDAAARREAIENDERMTNTDYRYGHFEPININRPWADPEWQKKHPINLD